MKINLDSKTTKTTLIILCVILLIISYFQKKTRNQYEEAKKLPFFNTKLENVADGNYIGKTTSSFLTLQLEVSVENHQIKDIQILEKKGSKGKKADKIIESMIEKNQSVVPAIPGEELASLIFISCCDDALRKGTSDYVPDENTKN